MGESAETQFEVFVYYSFLLVVSYWKHRLRIRLINEHFLYRHTVYVSGNEGVDSAGDIETSFRDSLDLKTRYSIFSSIRYQQSGREDRGGSTHYPRRREREGRVLKNPPRQVSAMPRWSVVQQGQHRYPWYLPGWYGCAHA